MTLSLSLTQFEHPLMWFSSFPFLSPSLTLSLSVPNSRKQIIVNLHQKKETWLINLMIAIIIDFLFAIDLQPNTAHIPMYIDL